MFDERIENAFRILDTATSVIGEAEELQRNGIAGNSGVDASRHRLETDEVVARVVITEQINQRTNHDKYSCVGSGTTAVYLL